MNWGMMSQAERDAAYNNAAAVVESARLVRERNEASAIFRGRAGWALDVAYGDGERLKWDFYPAAKLDAPLLVFIHGGYWQMNRREDFAIFAEGLLARGWAVAMAGYSLSPAVGVGEIVGELWGALDWLAAHGREHGVAGGPVMVAGWSAGAHLAALLLGHGLVLAGLGISGVYELGPLRDTYLNVKLRLTEAEIAECSPLRLAVVDKPFVVAYGTRELPLLVVESRNFHGLRAAAHAPGALLPVAGADHFTVLAALRSADGELVRAAEALL